MNKTRHPFAAVAALAFALSSFLPSLPAAATTSGVCASTAPWVVVRVTVDAAGAVASKRIVWQASDAAFRATALRDVGETTFTPDHSTARGGTFDYLLTTGCDGKLSTRIVPRLSTFQHAPHPEFAVSESR